jgi:hypothetical protein
MLAIRGYNRAGKVYFSHEVEQRVLAYRCECGSAPEYRQEFLVKRHLKRANQLVSEALLNFASGSASVSIGV